METQNKEISLSEIREILKEVVDPEIPVITIAELGILRDVIKEGDSFIVTITPTYSGCPATDMIAMNIASRLKSEGITNFKINTRISPAWTTDWITESGKKKLKDFGIAPPMGRAGEEDLEKRQPPCPHCGSTHTVLVNRFGSTACKALFRCMSCAEPFDYFKCH